MGETRELVFDLTPKQMEALRVIVEERVENKQLRKSLGARGYIFTTFRNLTNQWTQQLNNIDVVGYTEGMADPGSRDIIKITAADLLDPKHEIIYPDADQIKSPKGTTRVVVPFPAKMIERLERGLTFQNVWNSRCPPSWKAHHWEDMVDWAQTYLVQMLSAERTEVEKKAMEREAEELYPGLLEPVDAPKQESAEGVRAGMNRRSRRERQRRLERVGGPLPPDEGIALGVGVKPRAPRHT